MRWRNQMLALLCLVAFALLGVLYFRLWVIQKPFGIVLFIGEGLTPGRIAATRLYAGGADSRLAIDALPFSALLTNYSRDFAAPDQAAAATAIATGVQVNNGNLALNENGKLLRSLLELARNEGRLTGLVTNGRLTNPTAAAFYAHAASAENRDNLARQLAAGATPEIVLGGGAAEFRAAAKGGGRTEGRDLLFGLRRNGFEIVHTKAELEAVPRWRKPKLFGVFSDNEMAFSDAMRTGSEQPSLSDMVRHAIELLQYNRGGYLLVVDSGLMRNAAEANSVERTLAETVELDRAIGVARGYVGNRSTVIVAGDCGIGGLSLSSTPFRKASGVAVLGLNPAGDPWFTWAAGPKGLRSYGAPRAQANVKESATPSPQDAHGDATQEPAAVYAPLAPSSVDDMLAAGSGPGAEALRGSMNNTMIFRIIRDLL